VLHRFFKRKKKLWVELIASLSSFHPAVHLYFGVCLFHSTTWYGKEFFPSSFCIATRDERVPPVEIKDFRVFSFYFFERLQRVFTESKYREQESRWVVIRQLKCPHRPTPHRPTNECTVECRRAISCHISTSFLI
jgi:hypothetical protein